MKPHTQTSTWSISQLWNELLIEDYPIKPRNYIRASDIGKPFLDRYLAMKGVQPTNPFPARVKRIFDCGYIFEDIVERIFRIAGILIDTQKTVVVKNKGLLDVTGHYDYKIGGKIDYKNANEAIKELYENIGSEWFKKRAEKFLTGLLEQYPEGMRQVIAEIKSVNSSAFWAHGNQDKQTGFFRGYDHHKLQLLTYLMGDDEKEGKLFYCSKDDLTLMETAVFINQADLKKQWLEDVSKMTEYFNSNKEPEREENIVFNKEKRIFETNWRVARSVYLTKITGFATVEEWENSIKEELKKKNTGMCTVCKSPFHLITLNKNKGVCGRCTKKNGQIEEKPIVETV